MLEDFLLQDKCGIFGIWGVSNASECAYQALHNLQHRGQEHCGIVTTTGRKFYEKHGTGIVNDVFTEEDLKKLRGHIAIGHNRYKTQGDSSLKNAQPFVRDTAWGPVAVAHNGEFANYRAVKRRLQNEGCIFTTDSDTEVVLHQFVRSKADNIWGRVEDAFTGLNPAYSVVMLTREGLIGIRDPAEVRPLHLGRIGDGWTLASETTAFDIIKAKSEGEIHGGEMVLINNDGIKREQLFEPLEPQEKKRCVFEHIYFSRPDSFTFGSLVSNGSIREEFGRQLYREHPAKADFVIPVPDSSNNAALGYSDESYNQGGGIPINFGLIRSHYIGRTFILPTQAIRDAKVLRKFNPDRTVVFGKRLVVVDDSIVRATTMRNLVTLFREFGAAEIHLRIGSPPIRDICYLGINIPDKRKLIAYKQGSVEDIGKYLGVDSLGYLSIEEMLSNPHLDRAGYCTQCFDGIRKIPRR